MRVGLRLGRCLRVAFCREQSGQLYAEGFPALVCLPLFVILIIARAGGVVAGEDFEALSVGAHVNHIHLQRWRLRKHGADGHG